MTDIRTNLLLEAGGRRFAAAKDTEAVLVRHSLGTCMTWFARLFLSAFCAGIFATAAMAQTALPNVVKVLPRDVIAARARLQHNAEQVISTYRALGKPLNAEDLATISNSRTAGDEEAIGAIQSVLDKYVLATVSLDDEAWFTVTAASPRPQDRPLRQYHWETFLVKVHSSSRTTSPMAVRSDQALTEISNANQRATEKCVEQPRNWARWMMVRMVDSKEMSPQMSGREVEYFPVQICSLDKGTRAAEIVFYLAGGQVTQGHFGSSLFVFQPKAVQ